MRLQNINDVVIIGAGPIGMAMATRLYQEKIPFTVFEKGDCVGSNLLEWGHISLFTSWEESMDNESVSFLASKGVDLSHLSGCPRSQELVEEYLNKLCDHLPINTIQKNTEVTKLNFNRTTQSFTIEISKGGQIQTIESKIVIDASGTWGNFNLLLPSADSTRENFYSGIPNKEMIIRDMQGMNIAVIGNGHSAMNSILELSKYGVKDIKWVIRGDSPKFGRSKVGGKSHELENLVQSLIENEQVKLIPAFTINSSQRTDNVIKLISEDRKVLENIQYVITNIGAYPDYSFLQDITLNLDGRFMTAPRLANNIDPHLHSCDTVSYTFSDTLVTDIPYFVVGMKSFGTASNFLLAKGYKILDELTQSIKSTQIIPSREGSLH